MASRANQADHVEIVIVLQTIMSAGGQERTGPELPPISGDGPHPLISDSLFSLIIFIYVAVTFLYVFYAFCWRQSQPPPQEKEKQEIPMITEELAKAEDKVAQV